jgi:hypothetical protein
MGPRTLREPDSPLRAAPPACPSPVPKKWLDIVRPAVFRLRLAITHDAEDNKYEDNNNYILNKIDEKAEKRLARQSTGLQGR